MAKRRKKNRKKDQGLPIFPKSLAVVLLVAAVTALMYLWFCGRCESLGQRILALERDKEELHRRVINEEFTWANMKSPGHIEELLRHFRLDMCWPAESHVVRVRARPSPPPLHVADAGARGASGVMND